MIKGPGDLSHAIMVAAHASRPFVDKQGKPIILHALTVMLSVNDAERVPAVLHDVVEDTEVTLKDLRDAGFSADDVSVIDALTRRADAGERYPDYINRLMHHSDRARAIKLADLNVNLARVGQLPRDEQPRLQARYTLARHALLTGKIMEDLR